MSALTESESIARIKEEARRQSAKWWSQQQGKSTQDILDMLKQGGGGRPNPMKVPWEHMSRAKQIEEMNVQHFLEQEAIMRQHAANAQVVKAQFGRDVPVGVDPYYGMKSSEHPFAYESGAGAFINTQRTGALAEEMARLSELYPGTNSRLGAITVGRGSNAEGWNIEGFRGSGTRPGEIPYVMGTPAQADLLRDPTKFLDPEGVAYRSNPPSEPIGFSSAGPELYPKSYNRTGAHEFGHAVHGSMHDFAKELPKGSPGRAAYLQLLDDLGLGNQEYISRYADVSRREATGYGGVPSSLKTAAAEPFAETFAAARSPQGVDLLKGKNVTAATRDIAGTRATNRSFKFLDRVNQMNDTEKALRNEGWGEVGSTKSLMGLQVAAPILAGLLAAKTHGNARAALSGAATGAGLGGWLGPEGTVIGGVAGAGLGLAKHLIG